MNVYYFHNFKNSKKFIFLILLWLLLEKKIKPELLSPPKAAMICFLPAPPFQPIIRTALPFLFCSPHRLGDNLPVCSQIHSLPFSLCSVTGNYISQAPLPFSFRLSWPAGVLAGAGKKPGYLSLSLGSDHHLTVSPAAVGHGLPWT